MMIFFKVLLFPFYRMTKYFTYVFLSFEKVTRRRSRRVGSRRTRQATPHHVANAAVWPVGRPPLHSARFSPHLRLHLRRPR